VDEELRAAVGRGLQVDNLWAIVRRCTDLLKTEKLSNPIIALAIKAVCTDVASAQESEAVSGDYAELLDAHLLPAIDGLLDVSSGSDQQLKEALNDLARAYADTLRRQ
jgi:hypothetical protein